MRLVEKQRNYFMMRVQFKEEDKEEIYAILNKFHDDSGKKKTYGAILYDALCKYYKKTYAKEE